VQLQEDADLSAQDILDYLKKEVGERAAIPKEITIIDAIPLTPVGKIFKPALRWNAIKKVYELELAALQGLADKVDVTVGEDKVHGSLVSIAVKPVAGISTEKISEKVAGLLSRFTVKYRLEYIED